jgi:SulP family sulfate permease
VARYGTDAVFSVSMIAGVIVTVAAFLRLGRYLAFVPWPVIEGFTVGIAAIIFLQQVPSALGVEKPDGENSLAIAIRALGHLTRETSAASVAVVVLVAAAMVVAPRLHRALPSSLVAIFLATITSELLGFDVATIGTLPTSLPMPHLPGLTISRVSDLFSAALAVAALAAIESLLSARVADGMADVGRHDSDRELLGQGLANIVSPLFGGMPATGAIARTAVNVRAGARTRVASITHAGVLLVVVLFASRLVSAIPTAALSGVLMVTAVRMVERHNVRAVLRATRSDAIVFALTALATVAFDLIVAIEIGVAVAAVLALRHVARTASATATPIPVEIDDELEHQLLDEHIVAYRLDGALFFGAAQRFLTELTAVTDARVVILRMPQLQILDATGAQALAAIVAELEARHITVLIKGLRPEHARPLAALGVIADLDSRGHLFADLDAAVAHGRSHARRTVHAAAHP